MRPTARFSIAYPADPFGEAFQHAPKGIQTSLYSFGMLIDCCLGDLSQRLVGFLFFQKSLVEQPSSPGLRFHRRPATCSVVFSSTTSGKQTCFQPPLASRNPDRSFSCNRWPTITTASCPWLSKRDTTIPSKSALTLSRSTLERTALAAMGSSQIIRLKPRPVIPVSNEAA